MCQQCIVNLKQNLLLLEGVEEQLKGIKIILFQENEEQMKFNMQQLTSLKEQVMQFKYQCEITIEKCTSCLNQQIDIISNNNNIMLEEISNLSETNIEQFIQQFKEMKKSFLNYSSIIENIKKQLQLLISDQVVQQMHISLNKIKLGQENYSDLLILNLEQQSQVKFSKKLICEEHKSKVKMIDLNPMKSKSSRLACLNCVEIYPIKYTSLKTFQGLWQNHQIQQQQLQKVYNEKIQLKKQNFADKLQDLREKFENFFQKTQIDYFKITDLQLEHLKKISQRHQCQWNQLQNFDIIRIAEEISNIDLFNIQIKKEYEEQFNKDNFLLDQFQFDVNSMLKSIQKDQKQIERSHSNNLNNHENVSISIKQQHQSQLNIVSQVMNFSLSISLFGYNQKEQLQKSNSFKNTLQVQSINFKLINNSITQSEYCKAIAVNFDCSFVGVACAHQIKIFRFTGKEIKNFQVIDAHQDHVLTLNFMKNSHQLISGSRDSVIKIWQLSSNKKSWINIAELIGHHESIICLTINIQESLIISGSNDCKIKFWTLKSEWKLLQTISYHKRSVSGLSLNQSNTQLVSCGCDNLILIIKQQQEEKNQWSVVQQIKLEHPGIRVCFIDENIFTLQPKYQSFMWIFQFNNFSKLYVKVKESFVKCDSESDDILFPQQFVKKKQVLLNKNGQNINIIQRLYNTEFLTVQSIDIGTSENYGCISDDGNYLFIWDNKSYKLSIRQYYEI